MLQISGWQLRVPSNLTRFILLALLSTGSHAQERVLAADQINEAALVEALAPPPTRQWVAGQRPPAPKASLLITFVTNSAELTDQAKGMLDVLAGALQHERLAAAKFLVEGHADARGPAPLNQRLSLERARSVRTYLVGRHGLAEVRLRALGKGASQPLNTSVIDAPENRRVTIVTRTE